MFDAPSKWEAWTLMFGSGLGRVLSPGDWQLAMLGGAVSPRLPVASSDWPTGWNGPTRTDLGDLDLDAIAEDVVDRYTDEVYPAAVIGANHGSAAYLATLLGGPWLPSGIDVTVSDPVHGWDPLDVLHDTRALGRRLRTLFPGTAVSQRFPSGRLRLTWGRVPPAYRRFLAERVQPGGPVLLVRDACPAQILRDGADGSVQLEREPLDTPAGTNEYWCSGVATLARPGFAADVLRFVRQQKLAGVQLLFNEADRLSQLVADTTRLLLREVALPDSWLVIQHGCRIDTQPLTAGAVPYWCPDARPPHATAVECWLAGSEPFRHIDLVLEPFTDPRALGMIGWMSACRFAEVSAAVDLRAGSSLTPASHLGAVETMPFAPPTAVLERLATLANASGLLVT